MTVLGHMWLCTTKDLTENPGSAPTPVHMVPYLWAATLPTKMSLSGLMFQAVRVTYHVISTEQTTVGNVNFTKGKRKGVF
jgi:hypothetical protein